MKHILLQHIYNAPVIPSDWTKAECLVSLKNIEAEMHDLTAQIEEFEKANGFPCPDLEAEAILASEWEDALEEAVKTR
jgi:hypothetical protein